MTAPGVPALRAAMQATWPPAAVVPLGPFSLRRSPDGGRRVSAATAAPGAEGLAEALPAAEAQMRAWGQRPIFMVLPETPGLDALLESAGYVIEEPVILYLAPVPLIAGLPAPRLSTFAHWPPLAIQRDIWATGGLGADRVAVMERAEGPRISLLARQGDDPAGAAFAAIHDSIVCVHAVETAPEFRRQGVGRRLMARAAQWAETQGAQHLALAVTEANAGARALYTGIGMEPADRYHYRVCR